MDLTDDIILARNMRNKAYAKYSNYTVGAVLLAKNGRRYTGCNIENQGIQSICKAISEGERDFERILIVGGKQGEAEEKCLPCGYCRQFMSEFVTKDFKILNFYDNKIDEYTMEDLLPYAFEM